MANRFYSPDQQFADSTGAPYAGGFLYFYATGTTTPLSTYTDSALSVANANPVVLDSAGRAGSIFLQNLAYKVVLKDVDGVQIWTEDPVSTSDFTALAQLNSGSGSPNGVLAGTAGSAGIPASVYWDATNAILYVCTTTGTATTAVWTAVNASTAAAVIPPPQGYLTATSGTPIIAGDVLAATAVYYTPYVGLLVPIYNGTSMVPTSIVSELSLTLSSSHAASNIYDFFIFMNGSVPTLGTGPSWSAGTSGSITAGSCARGTGAGGTALSRVSGIWTNAVSVTMRYGNGSQTVSVNAGQGTYVGSMLMDGTNGQVSCYRTYGQSRKFGIWNAYNRANIYLKGGDATGSWAYNSTTPRQSNGAAGNTIAVFAGLAEEQFAITMDQNWTASIASGLSVGTTTGIGWNSTTAYTGNTAVQSITDPGAGASSGGMHNSTRFIQVPSLGLNNVNSMENGTGGGGGTSTFQGTESAMLLTVSYRG